MRTPDPHRRSRQSHRAILDAALDLAVRDGYAKVTVDAIAIAACAGKQTIYRWWPGKGSVVLEALNDRIGPATALPDTGDIATDLTTQANAVIRLMSTDLGAVYKGLLADAQSDPRLAADLRVNFIEPRVQRMHERLASAVAAGELRADVPSRTVVELLFGWIYYRLILDTDALDQNGTEQRVEYLLDGLRPRS